MIRSLIAHPTKRSRLAFVVISIAVALALARPLAGLVTSNLGVMALHRAIIGNSGEKAIDDATILLHTSYTLTPTSAVIRNLGIAAFASRDYQAALTYSERAGGPLGNWLAAQVHEALGNDVGALQAYQRAGAVPYLLIRGDAAHKAGDYETAKSEFLHILELEPASTQALVGLGKAYWDLGELDLALTTLNAALQQDPRLDQVHSLVGAILVRQGLLKPAIEHFLTAATIKPDSYQYCITVARTYEQAGDLTEAAHWHARCVLIPKD